MMLEGDARVAHVINEYRIVLNCGASKGVSAGDNFLVYGLGPNIRDPETGNDRGALEIVKGRGRVTHIQEHTATIVCSGQRKIPGTKKIITRTGAIAIAFGSGTKEEIEDGPLYEELAFEDPAVGDYARPV